MEPSSSTTLRVVPLRSTLPAALYQGIGRVAVQWSHFEIRIQALIWHLLSLDPKKGRVLTHGLSSGMKFDLLETACIRWVDDHDRPEIEAIIKQGRRVLGDRNDVIHGLWCRDPLRSRKDVRRVCIKRGDRRIIPKGGLFSASDVNKIADDVEQIHKRVVALLTAFDAHIP